MKILNTVIEYSKEAGTILAPLGKVDYIPSLSPKELLEKIGDYDVAVMALGLNFHKDVLAKAKKLKFIVTATTGLDHIDLVFAEKRGIKVLSLKGETEFLNTITGVAELTFGLLIDLARFTPWAFEAVKNYQWRKEDFRGHNLYGKTLGIVGLGRLGKMTARFGKAFGMKVLFTDPNVSPKDFPAYEKVSFTKLLKESDAISIHVPMNEETENLLAKKEFALMKKGAILINTSRGKIVNEKDLLATLKSDHLGGYGTDVLAGELSFETVGFKDYPLVEYAKTNRNVIIVPHTGGYTAESRLATDFFMAEKLKKQFV
ncbi:MAG: D-isomer specific 2-hydroxyacid dehydrogenase NAD-binding protein [Parcubacteria group bacterium GW2011_GWB1_44_7]|nr:MAG: D-isomer specific 2-hydroxyacid dehydrogenase NAD-binding protein [Parcubacteria group bacterium GW2011_GWB1_44_7]